MPNKAKKQKKDRKHKKSKKHKAKSLSASSSSSSDEVENLWVEKCASSTTDSVKEKLPSHVVEDNEWTDVIIPTYTRDELRIAKNKDKTEPDLLSTLDKPGQHPRELNPYWKDGGVGLPSHDRSTPDTVVSGASLSWLEAAYRRCQQQADETGDSLERIAADRWGSLERLEQLIAKAKDARVAEHSGKDRDFVTTDRRGHCRKQLARPRSRSSSPRSRSLKYRKNKSRSKSPKHRKTRSRSRSQSPNHKRTKTIYSESSRSRGKPSRGFRKPVDDDDGAECSSGGRRYRDEGNSQRWRKKGFANPEDRVVGASDLPPVTCDDTAKPHPPSSPDLPGAERRATPDSAPDDTPEDTPDDTTCALTDAELNELGAKILRAEILNDMELVEQLKVKMAAAQKLKQEGVAPTDSRVTDQPDVVILTRTTRGGMVMPLELEGGGEGRQTGRQRKRKVLTHDRDGQRERYFGDDDSSNLQNLVERERMGTSEDATALFARLAGKVKTRIGDDETVDELMLDQAAVSMKNQSQLDNASKLRAIMEHKKLAAVKQKCKLCFKRADKHLIIAVGNKVYLSLPAHKSIAPGHCLIVPMQHVSSSTALDEDVFAEVQTFRSSVARMFAARDQDCVFMEMSRSLSHLPHMRLECVPLPRELGDLAPIYFKKALMESESEWAQNKKLVDLSKKDVRHSIPKGFAYFAVDFGLEGGYGHVIEDERDFPEYFGREVVGGMLDVPPNVWRKPRDENFTDQSRKVLEFSDWWRAYDCTQDS